MFLSLISFVIFLFKQKTAIDTKFKGIEDYKLMTLHQNQRTVLLIILCILLVLSFLGNTATIIVNLRRYIEID